MATSTQWQLARDAAERYERILVLAILGPFAQALVAWAKLPVGAFVVDVGCGTGAATRSAAEHVGPTGRVVGIDINAGMLAIAQSLSPVLGAPIEWIEHSAYQLPIPDQSVDVVLCAQTLQFLDQRPVALAEMYRVIKPEGYVALSLWCDIQENPYFHALVDAVAHHIGPETAAGLGTAFRLSNADEIRSLLSATGLRSIEMAVVQLDLDLPVLTGFVPRHISATPMATGYAAASAGAQRAVVDEIVGHLAQYQTSTGVCIPFKSHMARGYR